MKFRHHATQISRSKRQPRTQASQSNRPVTCLASQVQLSIRRDGCKRGSILNPIQTLLNNLQGIQRLLASHLYLFAVCGTCTCLSREGRFSVCREGQWELKMPEINLQNFDRLLGAFLEFLKEFIKLHINFYLSLLHTILVWCQMLPAESRLSQSAPFDFLLICWPCPALSLSLTILLGSRFYTGRNCVWAKTCSRSNLMATGTPSLQKTLTCVWDFSTHWGEPSLWMHWYQRELQVLGWYGLLEWARKAFKSSS